MELRDYGRVLRQRWWVLLACTLAGLLLAGAVVMVTPKKYEATTELFVAPAAGGTSAELQDASDFLLNRVKSYVEIIDKAVILEPVIDELGLPVTTGELSAQVSAAAIPETVVVEITVEDETAEGAAAIANAVAAEFVALAPTLEPRRADESPVVRITVVDPAPVPLSPVEPQARLILVLGLLIGLAAGLAGAVMREALDRRVKGEADVQALTDVPVVGLIPLDPHAESRPVTTSDGPASIRAEALRQLRTNLQFLDVGAGRRSYVITSAQPGEGKTLTAINLAITVAEVGHRVCLLEADLRHPRIAHYLGVDEGAGLADTLIGAAEWTELVQTYRPRLDVLLAGTIPPNPSDLLASEAMDKVLTTLEESYDVVILDAPALLPVTDAAVLTKRCSGAIVVVGCGRKAVSRAELARSLRMLRTVDARVLGVVLNKLPRKGPNAMPVAAYAYPDSGARHARHAEAGEDPETDRRATEQD